MTILLNQYSVCSGKKNSLYIRNHIGFRSDWSSAWLFMSDGVHEMEAVKNLTVGLPGVIEEPKQ